MENLQQLINDARLRLETTYQIRESALSHGRGLTRTCANAIRAMHRREQLRSSDFDRPKSVNAFLLNHI